MDMLIYGRDKSVKLPRKTPKRTKPRYGDSFPTRAVCMPAFRSDSQQPHISSAIDSFLRTSDSRLCFPREDKLGWLDEIESKMQHSDEEE
jgi:hypothetical protein